MQKQTNKQAEKNKVKTKANILQLAIIGNYKVFENEKKCVGEL